eukprot:GILJ01002466.1.p3 GENE.GILJ01002466.1~~GILJ01002466.1.p3  ORF type:complete len:113 (+),score=12.18 GILJ01002466.1:327-665(+)
MADANGEYAFVTPVITVWIVRTKLVWMIVTVTAHVPRVSVSARRTGLVRAAHTSLVQTTVLLTAYVSTVCVNASLVGPAQIVLKAWRLSLAPIHARIKAYASRGCAYVKMDI